MHTVRQARLAARRLMLWTMVALLVATMALSAALLPRAKPVMAQTPLVDIQRVSVPHAEGNDDCCANQAHPSMSADGRYVAFDSQASNLVPGDSNGADVNDIFVHDRQTGETIMVSVDSDGIQANGSSGWPSISADGRYVAFASYATNLVTSDNNDAVDIFVHDRDTGETTRVSVDSDDNQCDGGSLHPSISADGWYVAFASGATNLVADDSNGTIDVFVHDRQTGVTSRVSLSSDNIEGDSLSYYPSISADGRYVAFLSFAANLVQGDANSDWDIFVHDRDTGSTTRVSVDSDGVEGNAMSAEPSISGDGRYVAFWSNASNLVADDNNGDVSDVFVHDRETGVTTRVSVSSTGVGGNNASGYARISADGWHVAFRSASNNLVDGDTNGYSDIFVHDRQTGETTRVSVAANGTQGNNYSSDPGISADGRCVVFPSWAGNLVADDTNGFEDVFVHDRETAETTRVSLGWDGTEGDGHSMNNSVSGDGRFVAFQSAAGNLVAGDTNGVDDIFVHDRQTGETTRVSVSDNGTEANDVCAAPSISGDGRFVAFQSDANNLVSGDTNGYRDIFVRDRQTGETTRVSVSDNGTESDAGSYIPRISADGRYVVFQSAATNLVDGDTNGESDVFLHDRQTGVINRVSVDSAGNEGNDMSQYPAISADGQYVSFQSWASNLVDGDTNGYPDVFVRDRDTGGITRVSVASDNTQSDLASFYSSISAEGRYVAFGATATNLVDDDTNGVYDIFVHDRQTGETTRVSVNSGGEEGNGNSYVPCISGDGRYVTFNSEASNLVTDDTNDENDIFVHDRQTGETVRVSVASDGSEGDGGSSSANISADGRYVTLGSSAANLVADDTNIRWDVFAVSWENPALACSPNSIDFGSRYQNSSASQILQIQNSGTGTLSYNLSETSAWCSVVPASGDSTGEADSVSVAIDTSGLPVGSYSCVILAESNGGLRVVPVHLAVLPTPDISVTPPGGAFGEVAIGSSSDQVFTVSNNGSADLVIGTVGGADPLAAPFSVVSNTYSGPVVPGDNFTIAVRFSPTANGSFSDSFDIPSNDPNTPSVTVTLTGATPNSAPTAPVVNVTPDNPATANDLVCSITAASTDADGDSITYGYQWYKDSVLQPALTSNTVAAVNTAKGEVWKCVVTPNDGALNGPTAEDQVTIQNSAPTAPAVNVVPDSPDTVADLVCNITTQSADADGDSIAYTYQWYKDDVLQASLFTNTVSAAETTKGEIWKCVVTPGDGTASGAIAEDQVTVQNTAPAAPVITITPENPGTGDDLVCSITTESTDADGDAVTYIYQWYKDDVLQSSLTASMVAAAETADGQVWRCVVTPNDGTADGPFGEDEVTVTGSADGFPIGAIVGIVVGVLALVAVAAFLWFRLSKKPR